MRNDGLVGRLEGSSAVACLRIPRVVSAEYINTVFIEIYIREEETKRDSAGYDSDYLFSGDEGGILRRVSNYLDRNELRP